MTHSLQARRLHAADRRHAGAPDAGDPRRRDRRPPLRPARAPRRASSASTSSAPRRTPTASAPLVPEIAALCDTTLAKFHFSAPAEEGFLRRLPAGRDTLVVAGCEAHVCVMQTVIGLLEAGHAVKWVADAVGSRHPHNRLAATERARTRRRRRRHDRDGDLRMARQQRASEVQAPLAADPLSRRRGDSIRSRRRSGHAHGRQAARRPSRSRRRAQFPRVIRSSARRIEVARQPHATPPDAARAAPSRCRCRRASRRAG